jgi:hypothetical protein
MLFALAVSPCAIHKQQSKHQLLFAPFYSLQEQPIDPTL